MSNKIMNRDKMKYRDTCLHARGESIFLDDINQPEGLLYGAVFSSPVAHGKIKRLDTANARLSRGVIDVFTFENIPGVNQIGGIIQDEVLLAEDHVIFYGEPIALVIARSKSEAKKAAKLIEVEIDCLPPVTDPREAFNKGSLIIPPRTFSLGEIESAWDECDVIVEGRADSGSQEHFYLETQGAMAVPIEDGGILIHSSTQAPSGVQRAVAGVLGLPMHRVEVDVRRLGGGFGGKEDQATAWACLAGLAAFVLKKPVKLVLDRHEDLILTGKRHPYSSDFKLGLKSDGSILAYEVMYYQNAGAVADLSTAILERTLFHCTNTYFIPNVKATAASCRTNLPPFTAFRGFGGPQAMFVMESAIRMAAEKLNMNAFEIQRKNLIREGQLFPYRQRVGNCNAQICWENAREFFHFDKVFEGIKAFNSQNFLYKKGAAVMPICFGISFTNTALNKASALVHVYSDGSVGVTTGAVEMGQGVNMKIRHVAARSFSISLDRIKMETTNTTRAANTSPTAASTGADLNGKATELACLQILERLKQAAAVILNHPTPEDIEIIDEFVFINGNQTDLSWEKLIHQAYWKRTNLSAQGYYATPEIYFDSSKEQGSPFAYHVYGTALIEVTLDCLRGTYTIDSIRAYHDGGKSLDLLIDKGQLEGGIIQGTGWMTIENVVYGKDGRLLTDTTSTCKVPDIKFTPEVLEVKFLEDSKNPKAVMNSKAVGEPPFMYGIGVYFALLNAMKAFRPEGDLFFNSPMTPEKVFDFLYSP